MPRWRARGIQDGAQEGPDRRRSAFEIEKARRRKATKLDLSGMGLRALPDSIGDLIHLEEADLSDNGLTWLPDSIAHLSLLQVLDLSGNGLTALPDSIAQLTQLRELDLSGNGLTALPDSIAQLTQLRELDLSGNGLTALPDSIAHLSQIQALDLSHNELTALPDSIGQLTQLRELNLTGNGLTALPDSVAQLAQLRKLELMGNGLTALPDSIGQLTQLRELDLTDNGLTALPDSIAELSQLEALYLHGNDRLGLPLEVLGPAREAPARRARPGLILDYYFRARRDSRPLNEAKLVLVGRGGAGKTSLVKRLVKDDFDPKEKETQGIQIARWPLRLKGAEEVRLNIWDFGGQEIMHATHQFFFTERALYLLVVTGREGREDADAEYWLRLIESFGGDSPVIVVLNKITEHPFDLNERALRQKYAGIRGFIKTDCADRTGLAELNKVVERETDRLPHLRAAFPASWFMIKERLPDTGRNFLPFEEYRHICAQHGEASSAAQEVLAVHLHNLGIVLNFRNDPRLQDTHVLNPHWVTNGIYTVLNWPKLKERHGELHLGDLNTVLDATEYPPSMRRFILDLMKKFELCFSFPDDDTHYLVPELLDKEEVPGTADFQPRECLNFQYHYGVMLEGLLPRFIVRTHALSHGESRWRTGVVLEFEGCRGLVRADVEDKKVFVSVSGPMQARRPLLAVVRSHFEEIHQLIPRLQPREMVPIPAQPAEVVPYQDLLTFERERVKTFQKVVGGRVVALDVQELLNGVDLAGARRKGATRMEGKARVRLFYSYSHKDEALRDQLETHLTLLHRVGVVETWHDRKIEAGDDWKQRIDENLERADIILLLVSADFIASDYCWEKEMKRALERDKAREARVMPVILRDVSWRLAPFAYLQALPKGALAVTRWPDRDSAWRNVSEGIERVVEEIRKRRP